MAIYEVKDGETILARHITAEEWGKEGLNFYSKDEEFIQAGSWHYNKGKILLAHSHNKVDRNINITQETLYIKRGSIKAIIYDLNLKAIDEWIGREGDIMILMQGGHGYEILEDGTQVLEIKNGPYLGADRDRVRL